MSVRDFDPTQLASDYAGILSQAGITFSYQGTVVTGIWTANQNMFTEFQDQRRDDAKYTVFFTTNQISFTPKVTQTLVRSGVTYFIEKIAMDAEGVGCSIDVCNVI